MLYGVDIHAQYQAGIDLATLKGQGYTFMVTKASEGTSIPSTATFSAARFKARVLDWVGQARALGMVPGLYHWLKAGNGPGQAQFFHRQVLDAGGPAGMLIQLDCEDNAGYGDVVEWATEWQRLTDGHPFLLYTGGWWWKPRAWDGARVTPYLWDSHYLGADADTLPDDPAAFTARIPDAWWKPGYGNWPVATMLQFTAEGDAGGIGNNVDLNVFPGTLEELATLIGGITDMAFAESPQTDPHGMTTLFRVFDGIQNLKEEFDNHVNNTKEKSPFAVAINGLVRDVAELKARPQVQPGPADVAAVKAALLDPAVLAAIAKAVTDEIGS
jgi:hypothetical protein